MPHPPIPAVLNGTPFGSRAVLLPALPQVGNSFWYMNRPHEVISVQFTERNAADPWRMHNDFEIHILLKELQ